MFAMLHHLSPLVFPNLRENKQIFKKCLTFQTRSGIIEEIIRKRSVFFMSEQEMIIGKCTQCGEELRVPSRLERFSC
ncbi:MAG: hypothetical protein R3Y62_00520, partial [Eubacteriales bacterium]